MENSSQGYFQSSVRSQTHEIDVEMFTLLSNLAGGSAAQQAAESPVQVQSGWKTVNRDLTTLRMKLFGYKIFQ